MRKYYSTIEETTWTSRPTLEKMIATTAGNIIGKPKKIEKADNAQKTFAQLWAKKILDCPQRDN